MITEHPGVLDVVVVGLPDPEWGHRVHAIVQPTDPDHAPDADELRADCKARLAVVQGAQGVRDRRAVPRSAAGKVNRSALVEERVSETKRSRAGASVREPGIPASSE